MDKSIKKSYSTLEQGFQKMLADEGVDKISDTSIWALKNNTQCSVTNNDFSTNEDCKKFLEGLKKYFKITGVVKYGVQAKWMNNYISNNASNNLGDTAIRDAIILADGTLITNSTKFLATPETKDCNAIKQLGGHMCSRVATNFDIDINGKKGPNEFGRDIFRFVISDEHGKLYPSGGKDFAIFSKLKSLDNNSAYWQNNIGRCGFTDNKDISSINGHGCAARIMENGWKMDY